MSNMLTNGAIFSTFKRTDSHTVRGGPSRKDGAVIYLEIFQSRFGTSRSKVQKRAFMKSITFVFDSLKAKNTYPRR